MPLSIPGPLVDFILLGPFDDRRQLQDSPILGDVWAEYGANPGKRLGLLIAPYRGEPAGEVAKKINDKLTEAARGTSKPTKKPTKRATKKEDEEGAEKGAQISCVHGFIAANLTFEEVLRHVAPLTSWWADKFRPKPSKGPVSKKKTTYLDRLLGCDVTDVLTMIFDGAARKRKGGATMREISAVPRFVALAGLILWAATQDEIKAQGDDARISELLKDPKQLAKDVEGVLNEIVNELPPGKKGKYQVYSVSRNRRAMPALERSVGAVKADAAKQLFSVECDQIGWAVLDSGIDAKHPAFFELDGKTSRVRRAFDFSRFRELVSLDNSDDELRDRCAREIAKDKRLKEPLNAKDADEILKTLAGSAGGSGSLRWDLVERLVEIDPTTEPEFSHGTHVAGIIGASKQGARKNTKKKEKEEDDFADGMCPDINLYDFRVLAPELEDTEFAIIAALQFIRYLNQRDTFMTIHGVNMSLSIPHNVRNYACGSTPICEESNRLSENGVVVVAAAGNHGYKTFTTSDGPFDNYLAFSITDPGNADEVITVGATHRFWPHTYGVSFFSSRGPTGDGRMKPDLVAPGEKIRAPLKDKQWGAQDGTSMAAPHVSGAAAMLMARYSEFRGRPRKIKQILCDTATDLARERSFQGRGMLDVLRAFQSI
jgi:serine protease AprX